MVIHGHTWSFMVIVGLGWSFMVIDGHFMQMPLQEANTPVRKKVLPGHAPKEETRNTECKPRTLCLGGRGVVLATCTSNTFFWTGVSVP